MAAPCSTGTGFAPDAMLETKDWGTPRRAASLAARPLSATSQERNVSIGYILTHGYAKAISGGELREVSPGDVIGAMQTAFETRKQRLAMLKERYKTWAALNEAIGWSPADPRLSQIASGSLRSGRGTPYVMGDLTARKIEEALQLAEGWMDTPPTYAELHNQEDPRALVMTLMEAMPSSEWTTVVRLVDALAQPQDRQVNSK